MLDSCRRSSSIPVFPLIFRVRIIRQNDLDALQYVGGEVILQFGRFQVFLHLAGAAGTGDGGTGDGGTAGTGGVASGGAPNSGGVPSSGGIMTTGGVTTGGGTPASGGTAITGTGGEGATCTGGQCTSTDTGEDELTGDDTSGSVESGCGCVAPASQPKLSGVLSMLLGLALLDRRRRRSSRARKCEARLG